MNRLLYAALLEVEHLARLVPIERESLSAARVVSLFFEDCRDAQILFGSSTALSDAVERLRGNRGDDPHDQMLALAGIILSRNSFETSQIMPGVVPFSWFVNLENLFEKATLRRLRNITPSSVNVYRGARTRPVIFPEAGLHRAEPDLILEAEGRSVVGDVKYKEWTGSAGAADLYQLLVHAKAFGADCCFLTFPSDQYEAVHLGPAVTGADTWLFALDVRDLDAGLARACHSVGIATQNSPR